MTFEGAVIKGQGITFAIIVVKASATFTTSGAQDLILAYQRFFPGTPIILMSQDGRGTPTFVGRKDVVQFLSNVSISRIPWKRYNYAD